MIRVVYHRNFLKSAKRLSKAEQSKLANLIKILKENPFHPLLHSKRLTHELTGFLSFRVTRSWRVIFQFLVSRSRYHPAAPGETPPGRISVGRAL